MSCLGCDPNCTYVLVAGSEDNVQNVVVNSSTGIATYTVIDFTQDYSFTVRQNCPLATGGQGVVSQDIIYSYPALTTCDTVENCIDYDLLAAKVLLQIPNTDTLTNNGNGTFTHRAIDGTQVTIDLKRTKFESLGGGQYRITDDYGSVVTFSIPDVPTVTDNGDGTFTFSNGADPDVTFDAKACTVVDNGGGSFTITDDFGTSINFTVPASATPASLTNNGDGTFTFDNNVDAPTTIDMRRCVATDNLDGTYDVQDDSGNTITITTFPKATLTDNGDDTWTYDNGVDAPVVIDIRKATILSLGGSNYRITDDFGNSVDVSTGTETVTVLGRAGDELTYANEDASNANVDLSDFRVTVTDNADGTYDLDDGVGNIGTINTITGVSGDANNSLSDGTDGKPFYEAMSTASVEEFTSSGTYTVPDGATIVEVHLIGGGGGGGGGHSNSTADYSDGGAGGGGGQYTFHKYTATELGGGGTNITVTIGAGGSAGSGGTYDGNDNQTAGGTGGTSTFGNFLIAIGGNGGGISNTLNTNVPTGGVGVSYIGYTSGNGGDAGCYQGSYQAATAGQNAVAAPGGGGGGAHGNTSSGGAGGVGFSTAYRTRTTTAGGSSGANGTAATSTTFNGGGGGGSRTSTATGGDGGTGARGGGGGGGGGSITAIRAGNGGAGGAGYCIVYAY